MRSEQAPEPKTILFRGPKEAREAAVETVRESLVPGVPIQVDTHNSVDLRTTRRSLVFISDGTLDEHGVFGVLPGSRNRVVGVNGGRLMYAYDPETANHEEPRIVGDYFSSSTFGGCADRGTTFRSFSYGGTDSVTIGEGEEFIAPSVIAALRFAEEGIRVDTSTLRDPELHRLATRHFDHERRDEIKPYLHDLAIVTLVAKALEKHGAVRDVVAHEIARQIPHDPERGGDRYRPIIIGEHIALPTDFYVEGPARGHYGVLRTLGVYPPLFMPFDNQVALAEKALLPPAETAAG